MYITSPYLSLPETSLFPIDPRIQKHALPLQRFWELFGTNASQKNPTKNTRVNYLFVVRKEHELRRSGKELFNDAKNSQQ